MKTERNKAVKPRSARYFDDQEVYFAELESRGINVSNLLRKIADIVIKSDEFLIRQTLNK